MSAQRDLFGPRVPSEFTVLEGDESGFDDDDDKTEQPDPVPDDWQDVYAEEVCIPRFGPI